MSNDPRTSWESVPLGVKVAFLSDPRGYGASVRDVVLRETRMSWVFLAGERVYKLKKPLRTDVLDFSTLARREAACRAELRLNRRLAARTYLDVAPLCWTEGGLAIGGGGPVVDWLVVMRRLDERLAMDAAIWDGRLTSRDCDRLAGTLAGFYAHARHVPGVPSHVIPEWRRTVAHNRRVLLHSAFSLPGALVRRVAQRLAGFLAERQDRLLERGFAGYLVDGHGDLRPEHIWLGEPLQIIDRLEFNARLRVLDPLSEIAFLDLECERLGAPWAGDRIRRGVFSRLPRLRDETLFRFYRACHAMVRARLAITHLLDPNPRTPGKWRPQALAYLELALADTARLALSAQETRRSASPWFS